LLLLPITTGWAAFGMAGPDDGAPALTNWQTAANHLQKTGALLAAREYRQAQAELTSSATNLPAPYARVAHLDLLQLEAAFNRAKDDESARLDALSAVCMNLHAYQAAAQLKAAALAGSNADDSDDDTRAWRLFETGKFKEATAEYQRKLAENQVSTFQDYYKKQIQLIEERPKSLTNVESSLELVREHYLKGFEGPADLFCSLRELNRVLAYAQTPKDRLAIYKMTIQCLTGLNDESGRDAWEEKLLRDMNSDADACAEVFVSRGIRAYLRKDYAQAKDFFRRVCQEYPNSDSFGDAQYNLGSTLQEEKKFDEAVAEFSKLFTSNVDDYKLVPGTSEDYKLYRHKAALRISECYEAKKEYARALDFAELARTQYKPLSWCHTCLQTEKDQLEKRITKLQDLVKKPG
jgi:TolA-binding protein